MADVYRMPIPKPPTEAELDELDKAADAALARVDVHTSVRQLIRLQRTAIRKLRIQLARTEGRLRSMEVIAAVAREERIVEKAIEERKCPGSECPPMAAAVGATEGRCPVCHAMGPLDGEVMALHERPDPPLRSA